MKKTSFHIDRETRAGIGFLAPLLLCLIGLILVPVAGTIATSVFRDVPYLPKTFIGAANYVSLLNDPAFWRSLMFTLLFVLVSVPLETVFGLGIALVLNQVFAGRGMLRAAVLIPWAVPAAVSGRIFELIYNYSYGAANRMLALLHMEPANWLGSASGAFLGVVAADAWKTTPFAAIILLAGLSAIPEDLYRQARVDRAGTFQRFFRITLPLLRPVLIVTLLFRTVDALRVFDILYVLTGGGPGGATTSLSLFGYRYFSAGDFGYASAATVILFGIAFLLSLVYLKLGGFSREIR